MAKITLSPITGSYASVTAINARYQQIEDVLNDNVFWRVNVTGEPNLLANDLDMASNSLINLAAPVNNTDAARLQDILDSASALSSITAVLTSISDAGGYYTSNNVEGALAELGANRIQNVKWFGATGDGVTDDTSAIQAALTANLGPVYMPHGKYKITSKVTIPDGVTLYAENGMANTFLNNDDTLIEDGGAVIHVAFGSGISYSTGVTTYYDNCAIELGTGSSIKGISFWYPDQDMDGYTVSAGAVVGTPTVYPATIVTEGGIRGCVIQDVNIGNAYIGIDVSRDNHGVIVENIAGFPLSRGIIHGSAINPIRVTGVNFSALRVLAGSPWIADNIAKWVMENGIALELKRTTWANYEKIFAFGYSKGIYLTDGAADATNDISIAGSPQNINIIGCGFDACPIGIYGDGYQSRIVIDDCSFTPTVQYSLTPSILCGIYLVANVAATSPNVSITNGRFWSVDENAIYLENQDGSRVRGCHVKNVGIAAAGVGIHLVNNPDTIITDNVVVRSTAEGDASSQGILIVTSNACIVSNNVVREFTSYAILLDDSDYVSLTGNVGQSNTLSLIDETSGTLRYTNIIKDNNSDQDRDLTDSDVVSGVLQVPMDMDFITYSGTTQISGIDRRSARGAVLVISFGTSCIVEDAGTSSELTYQKTHLSGSANFTATSVDILTLVNVGANGWSEVSRSVN